MPYPTDLVIDAALTRLTVKIANQPAGFVTDQICRTVPTGKQSAKYFVYGTEGFTDDTPDMMSSEGEPRRVDYKMSTDTFFCDPFEFFHPISSLVERNADAPLQPETDGIALMVERQRIRMDKRLKAKLEALKSVSGQNFTPNPKWDAALGDPLLDLMVKKATFRALCLTNPNVLIICGGAEAYLLNNEKIQGIIKYYDPQALINGTFPPSLLGMRVVIPGVYEQTANVGQITHPFTGITVSAVWNSDDVYMLYCNPAPGLRSATYVEKYEWIPPYTRRERETHKGMGGTNLYTGYAADLKVTLARAGLVFKDVLT